MEKRIKLGLCLLLICATGVTAEEVVVLPTVKDTQLIEGFDGATNKGYGGNIYWGPNDTVLMQWDLSGITIPEGEVIQSATLELFSAHVGGYGWNWNVTAYPMRDPWQEGIGIPTDGFGGVDFPWGPASIGDAVYAYKQVSATGLGTGSFATETVATAGVPWGAPGAKDTETDVYPRVMIDQVTEGPTIGYPPGTSLAVLDFTTEGLTVLTDWITGALTNNGMQVGVAELGVSSNWRVATRETQAFDISGTPGPYAPELTINIGPSLWPPGTPGDADLDGDVDGTDLATVGINWDPAATDIEWADGNFSQDDGNVDGSDLAAVGLNWNPAGGPAIPEPTTIGLMMIAGAALLRRRQR